MITRNVDFSFGIDDKVDKKPGVIQQIICVVWKEEIQDNDVSWLATNHSIENFSFDWFESCPKQPTNSES